MGRFFETSVLIHKSTCSHEAAVAVGVKNYEIDLFSKCGNVCSKNGTKMQNISIPGISILA